MAIGLMGCGSSSGPDPGLIVFSGDPTGELGGGYQNLLVMNPDGTGVRRLTRTVGDVNPSWSPDGTRVVFQRTASGEACVDPNCAQIWIVDADGIRERPLTPASALSQDPDWSRDGDRIVFERWVSETFEVDIYVMNADGSDLRQLTDDGANEDPAWSPDGERIAFSKEAEAGYEIWVMNADGSEQRRVTRRGASEHGPAWSPDGEQIVVTRHSSDCDTIVVLNDDGSDERTLLPGSRPAWSPDGSQIAYDGCGPATGGSDIWVMDADGENAHPLEAGPYFQPQDLDWAGARE